MVDYLKAFISCVVARKIAIHINSKRINSDLFNKINSVNIN